MGFPLPLPVTCRDARKRKWEPRPNARPSCAEDRVAANGHQGRYAPLRGGLRPSLTAVRCYASGEAGRDGGMVSSVEHRDGNKGDVFDISHYFVAIKYRGLVILLRQPLCQFSTSTELSAHDSVA
jgi:hypothetical protein